MAVLKHKAVGVIYRNLGIEERILWTIIHPEAEFILFGENLYGLLCQKFTFLNSKWNKKNFKESVINTEQMQM